MKIIIKNKKIDFSAKPLNIQCSFIFFCISPVENVSFVLEAQKDNRINSPCIFFHTKNY